MGINSIETRDPFGPNRATLSNITPFTYQDGWTFQRMLYALKDYVNDQIIPELNNELGTVYSEFITAMDSYLNRVNVTELEWKSLFDSFMADVTNNIAVLNDTAFSRLVYDLKSKTSVAIDATLSSRVDPMVREHMNAVIAGNRVVHDAAALAVSNAAAGMDIVTGTDMRSVKPLESDTGWAIPFADSNGDVMGGFDNSGVFRVAQPIDAPGLGTVAPSNRIVCIGDSLVYGYKVNGQDETFPKYLTNMHAGIEFVNAGYSGATIDDIRFRIGSLDVYCEIVGGIIPAQGSVTAIVKQKFGWGPGRENGYYGTLAGVTGTLWGSADGLTWRFERSGSGAATACAGKQKLVREDFYPNDTVILWMGRNDVSTRATGREKDVVSHVIASLEAQINHLRATNKKFLVSTILNMAAERTGMEAHNIILEINRRIEEKWPGNVVDMRSYIINQAIYDARLTPTAADLQAIREGAPPPQIMDGGSHPLVFMIPHIAKKWSTALEEKAYI